MSQLSIETILKLIANNTGKRVNLNLEELDQHIEFARAVERELVGNTYSGNWAEAKCEPCGGEGSVHCSTSYGMSKQCVQCRGSGRAQLAGHTAEPKAKELVAWIRWFLRNVNDPDDFRWVKMQEAAGMIESLIAAAPKLEVVGKIVANDPVHGWHMQALKPWDEIGDGTVLYAAHPDDCSKDVFGPDTGCVRSDCIPGTCAAALKEGDDALDARRHRYMRATTTAIRDPESGERIAVTPEMYDAAIDKAMADDPNATRGIKIKHQGDADA